MSNKIIPDTHGRLDVFGLIAQGKLPEYPCVVWKNVNRCDPRFLKTLADIGQRLDSVFVVAAVLSLISCCYYTFRHANEDGGLWTLIEAMTAMFLAGCGYVYVMHISSPESELNQFTSAISWLLAAKPLEPEQFPKDIAGFEDFYLAVLADMAKLVRRLEDQKTPEFIIESARTHLRMLFDGACGFGFIEDPDKGLGPLFASTDITKPFILLDSHEWFEIHHDWLVRAGQVELDEQVTA